MPKTTRLERAGRLETAGRCPGGTQLRCYIRVVTDTGKPAAEPDFRPSKQTLEAELCACQGLEAGSAAERAGRAEGGCARRGQASEAAGEVRVVGPEGSLPMQQEADGWPGGFLAKRLCKDVLPSFPSAAGDRAPQGPGLRSCWCPQRQAPFPDGHLALNLRPRNEWALPTPKSQDPQFTPAGSPWRLWATQDPQLRAGSVCTPPSHHSQSWGFQTTPENNSPQPGSQTAHTSPSQATELPKQEVR